MGRNCSCCEENQSGGGDDPCANECSSWYGRTSHPYPYPDPITQIASMTSESKSNSYSVTVNSECKPESKTFTSDLSCDDYIGCNDGVCWNYRGYPIVDRTATLYTNCYGNSYYCGYVWKGFEYWTIKDYPIHLLGYGYYVDLTGMKKISAGQYIVTISGGDDNICNLFFSQGCNKGSQFKCANSDALFNIIGENDFSQGFETKGDVEATVLRGPTSIYYSSCSDCKAVQFVDGSSEIKYPFVTRNINFYGTKKTDLTFAFSVDKDCFMYVFVRVFKSSKITETITTCTCPNCPDPTPQNNYCGCDRSGMRPGGPNWISLGKKVDILKSRSVTNPSNCNLKFKIERGASTKPFKCDAKVKTVYGKYVEVKTPSPPFPPSDPAQPPIAPSPPNSPFPPGFFTPEWEFQYTCGGDQDEPNK